MSEMSFPAEPQDNSRAAEKVRDFPQSPGVYLMKDAAGRVIYIGKAKNLRARAGSYFLKAAAEDSRTAHLVQEIRDIDYLLAESDVNALLMEARLIKDILPKYNRDLRDDKTFPYLEIHTHEEFPRVEITRTPRDRGTKLYGPFTNTRGLRGALQVLQKIFKFRTCSLDIAEEDPRWRWFRPCLLASIRQCSAPCNLRISKEDYRKGIHRLQQFLEGKKKTLLDEMRAEMETASKQLQFEEAARLRDEIHLLETLDQRGKLDKHVQPEVFPVDPKKGLAGLQKVLHLDADAADRRGHRHRPHRRHGNGGQRGAVHRRPAVQAGLSAAADPLGRRASTILPASTRPFRGASSGWPKEPAESDALPDILLIDGGKGQLHAALERLGRAGRAAGDGHFAGQARGRGLPGRRRRAVAAEPSQLCPAPAAIRPRRGPPLCPALSPSPAEALDAGRGMRGRKANREAVELHGPVS